MSSDKERLTRRSLRYLLQGIGSVLEILPPMRTYLPEEGDAEAIQNDWETVVSDLWAVLPETK